MHVCAYVLGSCQSQKRASDPSELKLQRLVGCHAGCWELNLAPPEKQPVLLTAKPFLQLLVAFWSALFRISTQMNISVTHPQDCFWILVFHLGTVLGSRGKVMIGDCLLQKVGKPEKISSVCNMIGWCCSQKEWGRWISWASEKFPMI